MTTIPCNQNDLRFYALSLLNDMAHDYYSANDRRRNIRINEYGANDLNIQLRTIMLNNQLRNIMTGGQRKNIRNDLENIFCELRFNYFTSKYDEKNASFTKNVSANDFYNQYKQNNDKKEINITRYNNFLMKTAKLFEENSNKLKDLSSYDVISNKNFKKEWKELGEFKQYGGNVEELTLNTFIVHIVHHFNNLIINEENTNDPFLNAEKNSFVDIFRTAYNYIINNNGNPDGTMTGTDASIIRSISEFFQNNVNVVNEHHNLGDNRNVLTQDLINLINNSNRYLFNVPFLIDLTPDGGNHHLFQPQNGPNIGICTTSTLIDGGNASCRQQYATYEEGDMEIILSDTNRQYIRLTRVRGPHPFTFTFTFTINVDNFNMNTTMQFHNGGFRFTINGVLVEIPHRQGYNNNTITAVDILDCAYYALYDESGVVINYLNQRGINVYTAIMEIAYGILVFKSFGDIMQEWNGVLRNGGYTQNPMYPNGVDPIIQINNRLNEPPLRVILCGDRPSAVRVLWALWKGRLGYYDEHNRWQWRTWANQHCYGGYAYDGNYIIYNFGANRLYTRIIRRGGAKDEEENKDAVTTSSFFDPFGYMVVALGSIAAMMIGLQK